MKRAIFMVFAMALTFTLVAHASDAMDAERDLKAMKGITEAFCKAKKICENKEHGEFTVYRYYAVETDKLLSPTEMKTIKYCKEKYQVKLTTKKSESIHIYCYDNSQPKLLLEKPLLPDVRSVVPHWAKSGAGEVGLNGPFPHVRQKSAEAIVVGLTSR